MEKVDFESDHEPDRQWVARFRRNLLRWYERHARDLPWRKTRDAYLIWISEVMLQQTTVTAVAPYFERFVARFPTIADLAEADEEDVLRMWEGLGYYSRARLASPTAFRSWAERLRGVTIRSGLPYGFTPCLTTATSE